MPCERRVLQMNIVSTSEALARCFGSTCLVLQKHLPGVSEALAVIKYWTVETQRLFGYVLCLAWMVDHTLMTQG